jgi:GT2 family glycosyltransferase
MSREVTSPQLSIVIVTWNGLDLTRRALHSVVADAEGLEIEVLVVDNGSTDGTSVTLASEFPSSRWLVLDRNYGFAAANNRGVDAATSQLIFLLNNDTVVLPGTLRAIVSAAAEWPQFDVFAAEMLYLSRPDVVDNRGLYLDHSAHFRQIDTGRAAGERSRPAEVFGASGGAAIIRRTVIDAIGLFDETLESYLEDADFAARARAKGHRCLFVPGARILHEGSATGNRMPSRKTYLIQRNLRVLARRWVPFVASSRASWLGLAYVAFQLAKHSVSAKLPVVLRARTDALGLSLQTAPSDVERANVREWIGRRWCEPI